MTTAPSWPYETAQPTPLLPTEIQVSGLDDTSYVKYPGYVLQCHFLRKAGVYGPVSLAATRRPWGLYPNRLYRSHSSDAYSTLFSTCWRRMRKCLSSTHLQRWRHLKTLTLATKSDWGPKPGLACLRYCIDLRPIPEDNTAHLCPRY